jgi:ABC-type glycerol-3-phosphate transport system permease component
MAGPKWLDALPHALPRDTAACNGTAAQVGAAVCPCSSAPLGDNSIIFFADDDDGGDDYASWFPEDTPLPSITPASSDAAKSGLSTGGTVAVSVVVTLAVVGLAMLAAYEVASRRAKAMRRLKAPLTSADYQARGDAAL